MSVNFGGFNPLRATFSKNQAKSLFRGSSWKIDFFRILHIIRYWQSWKPDVVCFRQKRFIFEKKKKNEEIDSRVQEVEITGN